MAGYEIDLSLTAAFVAAGAAVLAAFASYQVGKSRHDLDARIEICKYREKWLEALREVLFEIMVCYSSNVDKGPKNLPEFERHLAKLSLMLNYSNRHWDDMNRVIRLMHDNFGNSINAALSQPENSLGRVSKRVLKDEWDEIQNLLYKKRKKKNAKV